MQAEFGPVLLLGCGSPVRPVLSDNQLGSAAKSACGRSSAYGL